MSDQSVNNAGPDDANTREGQQSPLDQLYATMGYAQAGLDSTHSELEHDHALLLRREQSLLDAQATAHQGGDQDTHDQLDLELDEVRRALRVLDHHLTDEDASVTHDDPQDEHGDQRPDRRDAGRPER